MSYLTQHNGKYDVAIRYHLFYNLELFFFCFNQTIKNRIKNNQPPLDIRRFSRFPYASERNSAYAYASAYYAKVVYDLLSKLTD
jgi:hypothetical protein